MSESQAFQMLSLVSAMCRETGTPLDSLYPGLEGIIMDRQSSISSTCAQCGKGDGGDESSETLKPCDGACKMVSYCSPACQQAHRPVHQKACMKRVTEMQEEEQLFEQITEDTLFKQPPLLEDCPICMLPMPAKGSGSRQQLCCGKVICSGCIHAFKSRITKKEHDVCPFCRAPPPNESKLMKVLTKRMKKGDAESYHLVGCYYQDGKYGLPTDRAKAVELWRKAAKLGCVEAYNNIGNSCMYGMGVERDERKGKLYIQLAAIGGNSVARYNLGQSAECGGKLYNPTPSDVERALALKHWQIAVKCGCSRSLQKIQQWYKWGHVAKQDFETALRSRQEYLSEIRSVQRDEAAAIGDHYKYY